MLDKVDALFARLEEVMAFQAIRQGLILTIPVLLVGSFCLIFLNLPLEPYQDALAGAPHIEGLLNFVYNATMGIFSLYVAVAVALRYANACAERHGAFYSTDDANPHTMAMNSERVLSTTRSKPSAPKPTDMR